MSEQKELKQLKYIKACYVLSNGIDEAESWFRIGTWQKIYDFIAEGDYVHLSRNYQSNVVSLGKVIEVHENSKQLPFNELELQQLPFVISIAEIDEFDLIDGMEVI